MPILVCLGTTAVLELRRMAMRGDEGKALDELRASEQKLTKLVQVGGARCREKEESSLREPPQGESGGFVAARGGGKRREFAILAEELFPDQIWSLSGSEIQTAAKEKERLQQLAEELKIADRVIWMGWQKDLESFYRVLDVMVFNSDWDAMGRTPLEAMSYGVPVVASMLHGGLGEMIDSEDYGFLLDRHDIPAMARKVVLLLSNEQSARKMGEAARKHIAKVGSPRKHAEKVAALLSLGR